MTVRRRRASAVYWRGPSGIVDDKTKIVLNHFSHNGGANYDDLVKLEKELGVIISYDGLEVEF